MAATEHGGCDTGHDWLRLNVQVAVHLVGPPAADKANAVAIDARAEHGHGTAGAGGPGREVARGNAQRGVGSDGETDAGGQDGGSDILKRRRVAGWGGADRVKGGGGEAALGTERKHPRRKARHRAKSGVAGASVAKRLAADAIFLRGERESSKGGGVEVSRRTQHGIQTARAEPEVDIVQAKQIVRCAGATGVLAGAEKEVKTNDETVGGSASHRGVFQMCGVDDRGHNGKRERFDAFGGLIKSFPASKQGAEAEVELPERV